MFSGAPGFSAVLGMCAFILFGAIAQANEGVPASFAVKTPPRKISELHIYPPSPFYPAELIEKGVQGKLELLLDIAADGSVTRASVQQSSRSEALDQAVLTYFKGLKFEMGEKFKPGEVIVPFEFARDTLETLKLKSCAEFNVDLQYFKTTFPDKKIREMPGMNLSGGILMGLAMTPTDRLRAYMKVAAAAEDDAFARCAREPDARFLQVLIESSERLMQQQESKGS